MAAESAVHLGNLGKSVTELGRSKMMSHGRFTMMLAAAGGMAFFAVSSATAQTPEPGARIYPVHFPTGSATLGGEDKDTIRGVASSMKGHAALKATIVGKADTVGSPQFNEKLAQRRAQAVVDALVRDNNVPAEQVQMHSTGEELPYIPTGDETPEQLNRLVEIVVQ